MHTEKVTVSTKFIEIIEWNVFYVVNTFLTHFQTIKVNNWYKDAIHSQTWLHCNTNFRTVLSWHIHSHVVFELAILQTLTCLIISSYCSAPIYSMIMDDPFKTDIKVSNKRNIYVRYSSLLNQYINMKILRKLLLILKKL